MSKPDDGGPAFPQPQGRDEHGFPYSSREIQGDGGMTLRDWFAGQALAGMLDRAYGIKCEIIAARSYEMADAMIAARNNLP